MAKGEEDERKALLHRLDLILDALERLNLRDAKELPDDLRAGLTDLGVAVPAEPNFTDLIEAVWAMQEQFLQQGMGDPGGYSIRREA